MAETKRFMGLASRSELRAANNLGTIMSSTKSSVKKLRKPELELFDSYYESRQYDNLAPWDTTNEADGSYVPVRKRKPRLQYSYAKVLCSRLASKLVGTRTFPAFNVEVDPDTQEYLRLIIKTSGLKAKVAEPVRRALAAGSSLVRFSIVNGQWKLQHFLAKWCFPEFDTVGNLEFVKIQYVYDDEADRDQRNIPKKKWFRMDLGKFADVLYDTPEYQKDVEEPVFTPVATANHDLGFVQGEWIKTSEVPNSIDGYSVICDITDFIDELNYSLSQSSTAIQYNQDPQLTISNMDEDEMEKLIRSSMKAWNLGREGKAEFLEAGMAGVEAANEFRDKIRANVQDLTRVVILDPEKIVGSAQSAKAMEVLHGPMVELIEELRPQMEKHLTNLVLKMAMTNLIVDSRGGEAPIPIPPGYKPQSLDITVAWPEIFAPTMQDLQQKVSVATQAASANIISRETMTKWLAKEFGVENIEEEIAKIAAQPVINPFGGF
jgi:Phage portal protein, SPP1 Gp6-like